MCSCRQACTLASGDEGRSRAFTLTSILSAASFTLSWISETGLGGLNDQTEHTIPHRVTAEATRANLF